MRIIFLDIDGVLNHHQFYKERHKERHKERLENPDREKLSDFEHNCDEIDSNSVELLNEIVEKTDVKFVISSTWRILHSLEEIQSYLSHHNFKGEIIGKTPRGCGNCLRGNEILDWMKANEDVMGAPYHEYTSYLILDDDSDMLYWQRNNFINIDRYVGLTPKNVYKAVRFLEGKGQL